MIRPVCPFANVIFIPDGHVCRGGSGPRLQATGTKINPNNRQIRALFWDGASSYHAVQAHVSRRLRAGFEIGAAFTWSRSIDTGSSTLIGNAFSNAIAGLPWYDLSLALWSIFPTGSPRRGANQA